MNLARVVAFRLIAAAMLVLGSVFVVLFAGADPEPLVDLLDRF